MVCFFNKRTMGPVGKPGGPSRVNDHVVKIVR
jgi:hypothetical protein